jgi:anti-anti-sigma factor
VIETTLNRDSSILCRPIGQLDWAGAISLRHVIHDSLAPGVDIVIDLSRAGFVDAAGMSALVGSVRLVRALGGTARVCNVRPRAQRLMELVCVDRLLMGDSALIVREDALPARKPA